MESYGEIVENASRAVRKRLGREVEIAMMLGSGLGGIADELEGRVAIPYGRIPGFPSSTVSGHSGELLFGVLWGRDVLIFSGRFHLYQGYSMQEVTLPVRVAKRLGTKFMIITNACGGINEEYAKGDIMLITDHINFMGANPLTGMDEAAFGSPFVDMSNPYDQELTRRLWETAAAVPVIGAVREGTYIGVHGPSYETRAEISFFRRIGADAVGMSTVPEVIVCAQEGIRVVGIAAVSNMAAGVQKTPLSHREVLENTAKMSDRLKLLIKELFTNVLP
jgi:purine-nucleoside phosphorylase